MKNWPSRIEVALYRYLTDLLSSSRLFSFSSYLWGRPWKTWSILSMQSWKIHAFHLRGWDKTYKTAGVQDPKPQHIYDKHPPKRDCSTVLFNVWMESRAILSTNDGTSDAERTWTLRRTGSTTEAARTSRLPGRRCPRSAARVPCSWWLGRAGY